MQRIINMPQVGEWMHKRALQDHTLVGIKGPTGKGANVGWRDAATGDEIYFVYSLREEEAAQDNVLRSLMTQAENLVPFYRRQPEALEGRV